MTSADDQGLGGVTVTLVETGRSVMTGDDGEYRLAAVSPGEWTVAFSLRQERLEKSRVAVLAGRPTRLDKYLDWQIHFGEAVTVTSASRRRERAIDAPAAVTLVTAEEIERRAPSSQVPKLAEHTPGLELTQSSLYDFNVNLRGFNGPFSRRIAVLVDSRDTSMPFLGAQEWGTLSLPLDDVETLEVVRGANAALYGPNASSGVLNLITKSPRQSAGGMLRLTAGELATTNLDLRWAGQLGGAWWKILGGYRSSDTFTVPRRGAAEYAVPCPSPAPCLPQEAVDPADSVDTWAGSLRFDRAIGHHLEWTLEAGGSSTAGVTLLSNLGRLTFVDVDRTWARARLSHPRWNVQGTYNGRDAPSQTNLATGLDFALDSETWSLEAQGHLAFGADLRLLAGGFFRHEAIDSAAPESGLQTLLFEPVSDQAIAAFAQLEWQAMPSLKLVLAGRWDDSETFYERELSPRASLVWSPNPRHTFRFSYNEAFQAPNYAEKFAQAAAAPGLDLQALEAFCTPFGVECGFAGPATRQLAVGNPNLGVETIRSFEIGYQALLGRKAFLTLDVYRNDNENFITDLLPELTTPLGDINPFFGPYRPPVSLPDDVADQLLTALRQALGPRAPLLTNNLDGDPFLALLTFGSFGAVSTYGLELAGRWAPNEYWGVFASTSLFEFDLESSLPGLDQVLSPNAPRHQARATLTYSGERAAFDLSGRWVDDFFWASGAFAGEIPAFTTFDLSGSYRWSDRVSIGLHVSNLFDDRHYEAFGGDLIGRRALASLAFRW